MTDETDVPQKPPLDVELLAKIALAISVVLLGARLMIAEEVGFGDAEALYAVYALFGQATYLDHPGLVGWLGSLFAGANGALEPVAIHRFTAVAATTLPWLGGLAARGAGASWKGVIIAVISLLIVPELAVGLFAFTPDLPLAAAWLGALGLAAVALRAEPSSTRAFGATLGAGVCTGLACASKVSGVLLAVALIATWAAGPVRARLRTLSPYAAVVAGALVTLPMLLRESSLGWPMLQHRLVNTQVGFGPSLRNLGALIGGQLLYLTPVIAVLVVLLAIDLARRARQDPIDRLLFNVTVLPFGALAVLTILSRVAEPHWVAPAYLGLALHLARRVDQTPSVLGRKLSIAAVATSLGAIALVFAVVLFPVLPKVLGKSYEPKYDLINDLYAWKPGAKLVEANLQRVHDAGIDDVSVVGPHWIVCAQLQAALGRKATIGCETPEGDDFQVLHPRTQWEHNAVLLYVTDDRFPVDMAKAFPNRAVQGVNRIGIRRGGVLVRTIRVVQLGRMGSS